MKALRVLAAALLALALMGSTAMAADPLVRTIPSSISYNSSFLWVVSLAAPLPEPARVGWSVLGSGGTSGAFLKLDNLTWFCDFPGNCGPTPFSAGLEEYSQGDIDIYMDSGGGQMLYNPVYLGVSDIKINPIVVDQLDGKLVKLLGANGCGANVPSFMYTLYDAATLGFATVGSQLFVNRPFVMDQQGFWSTQVSLGKGRYYMAIDVTCGDNMTGGTLLYFDMGQSESSGPKILQAAPAIISESATSGGNIDKPFAITNPANATYNLSMSCPSVPKMSVTLSNDTIGPESSMNYRVKFTGIDRSTYVEGFCNLSISGVVQRVPLSVNVFVSGSGSAAKAFTITPSSWGDDFAAGDEAEKEFTIRNTGSGPIEVDYETDIDEDDTQMDVELPGEIAPGDEDVVTVNMQPASAGRVYGTITISSGNNEEEIAVDLNFMPDPTDEIDRLLAEVEAMTNETDNPLQVFTDIADTLASAKSEASSGNYLEAKNKLDSAQAQFTMAKGIVEEIGGGDCPGGDSGPLGMIIVVILVVALVGIGAWFYLTKYRPAAGMEPKEKAPEKDEGDDYEGDAEEPY